MGNAIALSSYSRHSINLYDSMPSLAAYWPSVLPAKEKGDAKTRITITQNSYAHHEGTIKYYSVTGVELASNDKESIAKEEQKNENITKLAVFKHLEPDWNGYGAVPIPAELISRAQQIVKSLACQPEVFPLAEGAIMFEFADDRGGKLFITLRQENTASIAKKLQSGRKVFETCSCTAESISKVVNDFYDGRSV